MDFVILRQNQAKTKSALFSFVAFILSIFSIYAAQRMSCCLTSYFQPSCRSTGESSCAGVPFVPHLTLMSPRRRIKVSLTQALLVEILLLPPVVWDSPDTGNTMYVSPAVVTVSTSKLALKRRSVMKLLWVIRLHACICLSPRCSFNSNLPPGDS